MPLPGYAPVRGAAPTGQLVNVMVLSAVTVLPTISPAIREKSSVENSRGLDQTDGEIAQGRRQPHARTVEKA